MNDVAKKFFDILTTSLSVHNYFNNSTKLYSDLYNIYLAKSLNIYQ